MGSNIARAILNIEKNARKADEELLTKNNEALIDMGHLSVAEMESTIARNWNKPSEFVIVRSAIRALGNVFAARIKEGQPIEQKNENYLRWCVANDKGGVICTVASESLCKMIEAKVRSKADSKEKTPNWQALYSMHAMLNYQKEKRSLDFFVGRDEELMYDQMNSIIHACKENDIKVPEHFESMVKEKRNQLQESSNSSGSGYNDDSAEEHPEQQSVSDRPASRASEDGSVFEERKEYEVRIRRGELSSKEWRDAVYDHEIEPYIDKLSGYDVERNKLKKWYYESDQSMIKPKIVAANVQLMVDFGRKKRIMTEGFKKYISSEEGWNDSILSKSFQNCYADDGINFYSPDKSLPTLALADDKCRDDSGERVLDRSRASILVHESDDGLWRFGVNLDVFAQYLSKIPGINTLVHAAPLFQEGCGESVLVPDAVVVKEATTYHAFDPRASIAVNYLCAPRPEFQRDWYLGTERVRFTELTPYIEHKCLSNAILERNYIDTPDSISFISPRERMPEAAREMLLQRPNVYNLALLSRNEVISIINDFMGSQDGGIGVPNPVHKSSLGNSGTEVWMLKAGESASNIADKIHSLDIEGKSSILQERVNSPEGFEKKGGKEVDCSARSLASRDLSGQSVVTGIFARVGATGSPVNSALGARNYFLEQWINMLTFQVDPDEVENQIREITRKGYDCVNATIPQDPMYQASGKYAFEDYSSLMGADIMFRPAVTVRTSKEKALHDEIVEQLPQPPLPWIRTDEKTGKAALRMRPSHRHKNGWIILPTHQGTEQKLIKLSDDFQETAKGLKWDCVAVTVIELGGPYSGGHQTIRELSSQLPDDDKNVKKWGRGANVRRGQAHAIAYLAIQAMQNQKLLMAQSSSLAQPPEQAQRAESLRSRSDATQPSTSASWMERVLRSCCMPRSRRSRERGSNNRP